MTQPPPWGIPYRVPDHPRALTALVLGVVAVAGGVICYLPLLLAPFAWAIGGKAVREIDASHGYVGGRGPAQAGRVLGIVGTVLLVLAFLALGLVIAFLVVAPDPSRAPIQNA